MKARAKVFCDDKGNRVLFPAYIYRGNEELPGDAFWFTERLRMRTATGLDVEADWFEFDDESFPHIKTSIGSSGFAHGAEDVFLFDGPEFEEAMAHQAPAP
ncbi:hypothetical protein [Sulfitobacter sp. R18_1]|uniref:hypothetical protein n=1 Tax=Sulfitobacter sp. R18_1 TaxID=2821104 RepID=UPI001ADC1D82|nr:hypothetical protein [Sulfitobacter sp. R18_1]MBO9428137.1 hypothetical protein [Sulfitobacter sp. R18_1]